MSQVHGGQMAQGPGLAAPRDREGPIRVLVVDDEPSVTELCVDFLTSEGFEPTVAQSGEEALRLIPNLRPDVILTDINLPGVSGIEVLRCARNLDPDACVIVVTGYASIATAIEALRQGAYDFIRKPFDLEFVQKIIKSGLANRRLKLENRELISELSRKTEILERHEQELRERVKVATIQLTNLYHAGQQIGASLELGPRLHVIATKAAEMTGAKGAVIYLRREDSDEYRAFSAHGVELEFSPPEHTHFRAGQGAWGRCVVGPYPWRTEVPPDDMPFEVPGLLRPEAHAILAVPLATESTVIGLLGLLDKPGGFNDDDEKFTVLYASQAAIAIRNSQLFEHAKTLDRLKSEFVAVVSHEIRTPLTSVKGALELLEDHFQNNEQQAKFLHIARANAERLMMLITDILDFSKLESSSLTMNFERHRLEPVVTQAAHNLRTLMEERHIQLEMRLDPDLPDLMMDPHRIIQVLTNLLSNAIKFSPHRGGKIEITAGRWNGMARVSIRDNGEGIATTHLPRLFQKFSQIDSTSTRTRGGAGLGLVISKGIVEQHGGTIEVESVMGEGSTFSFTLAPATEEVHDARLHAAAPGR